MSKVPFCGRSENLTNYLFKSANFRICDLRHCFAECPPLPRPNILSACLSCCLLCQTCRRDSRNSSGWWWCWAGTGCGAPPCSCPPAGWSWCAPLAPFFSANRQTCFFGSNFRNGKPQLLQVQNDLFCGDPSTKLSSVRGRQCYIYTLRIELVKDSQRTYHGIKKKYFPQILSPYFLNIQL